MSYQDKITQHYIETWQSEPRIYLHDKGPYEVLSPLFRILEFEPVKQFHPWIYATVFMSSLNDINPIELHLYSSIKDISLIELLTAVAYYNISNMKLDLNHTINFGRSWQANSKCEFGLISLPYLNGPILENFQYNGRQVKCYWLVPITEQEKQYKLANGLEQLESRFEEVQFNYIDPNRNSVV